MSFLKPYLYCALFLLAMLLLTRIAVRVICFFTKLRFFSDGMATTSSVAAYMICRYGENAVISHRFFPSENGGFEEIPLIVVMKTGIAVIETKHVVGNLSLSGESWRISRTDRYGETRYKEFPNPVLENEIHTNLLEEIFRRAHLRKIPRIIPITVMPIEQIRFHSAVPKEITSPVTLPRFLSEADRGKPLSKEEKKAILSALERYARTRRQLPTQDRGIRH